MERDLINPVRSFNRIVTQRMGTLNEQYLSRDRPVGASRVLWDINNGADVRAIRERLDLDPGYLSRLLRKLETENLVRVRPAAHDHRVRIAELTKAGRFERAELDRRADELAWSLLEPLNEHQRHLLIEAMGTVERLLTVGLVVLRIEDPHSAAAIFCRQSYYDELDERFKGGYQPENSLGAKDEELIEPTGLLLVAYLRDEPIGCGALRNLDTAHAEIKQVWVSPAARWLGVGRRLVHELESQALQRDVTIVRLDTNRTLVEAISLYRSAGYHEVVAFNDEPYAHHWFEKHLTRHPSPSTSAPRAKKK
jgi:DNA-binding MarR family transcriptional regulator